MSLEHMILVHKLLLQFVWTFSICCFCFSAVAVKMEFFHQANGGGVGTETSARNSTPANISFPEKNVCKAKLFFDTRDTTWLSQTVCPRSTYLTKYLIVT
jgi:hypothetical protein